MSEDGRREQQAHEMAKYSALLGSSFGQAFGQSMGQTLASVFQRSHSSSSSFASPAYIQQQPPQSFTKTVTNNSRLSSSSFTSPYAQYPPTHEFANVVTDPLRPPPKICGICQAANSPTNSSCFQCTVTFD